MPVEPKDVQSLLQRISGAQSICQQVARLNLEQDQEAAMAILTLEDDIQDLCTRAQQYLSNLPNPEEVMVQASEMAALSKEAHTYLANLPGPDKDKLEMDTKVPVQLDQDEPDQQVQPLQLSMAISMKQTRRPGSNPDATNEAIYSLGAQD